MNASDLTAWQAEKTYERICPAFESHAALQRRMEEQQFPGNDRLHIEVKAARDTMLLPCKELHAVACHNYGVRP